MWATLAHGLFLKGQLAQNEFYIFKGMLKKKKKQKLKEAYTTKTVCDWPKIFITTWLFTKTSCPPLL